MPGMIGEPRVVDAGRGAAWWEIGVRLFFARFWTWIAIMIVYFLISGVIGSIDYVETVAPFLLTPVFMGGLMLGCKAIEQDGSLRVTHLFEGFQGAHFVPLMIIGAVNIALVLCIVAIVAAGVFGGITIADMLAPGDPFEALARSLGAISGMTILGLLVILVIGAVFAMLNWFAPALVALRGATAVEAMRLSFFACLRNWVPFLVYGLIFIAVAFGAILLIGAIGVGAAAAVMLGTSSGLGEIVGLVVLLVVVALVVGLMVGPIVFCSTYASYKDTLGE